MFFLCFSIPTAKDVPYLDERLFTAALWLAALPALPLGCVVFGCIALGCVVVGCVLVCWLVVGLVVNCRSLWLVKMEYREVVERPRDEEIR